MSDEKNTVRIGLTAAIGAHLMWGVFPIFWKQFDGLDSLQVVAHRVAWSFVFLLLACFLLLRTRESRTRFFQALGDFSVWRIYSLAALLIAVNWLTFIWAVNHDRVLQASLGYYINPLLNVVMGVFLLGERLSRVQWIAIASATIGVAILTYASGGLPWVSLVLATSFATYAFVKKKTPLPALQGLFVETATLLPFALLFLCYAEFVSGEGVFQASDLRVRLFLVLGGTITIAPLALFAFAARRAPLSAIGLLQYIAPTMQFLLGLFLYGEDFDGLRLTGFAFVWLALAIYISRNRYR